MADGHDDVIRLGRGDQGPALLKSRSKRLFDENVILPLGKSDRGLQMHPVLRGNDDGVGEFRTLQEVVPVAKLIFGRDVMSTGNTLAEKIARLRNRHDFGAVGKSFQVIGVDGSAPARSNDDHRCLFHAKPFASCYYSLYGNIAALFVPSRVRNIFRQYIIPSDKTKTPSVR